VAIALTKVNVALRNGSGDKIVRIEHAATAGRRRILQQAFACNISQVTSFVKQKDNVHVSVKVCLANTPRNYAFICKSPSSLIADVNGRYVHNHSLVENLKGHLSKGVASIRNVVSNTENLTSSIVMLDITAPEQPCISVVQKVTSIMLELSRPEDWDNRQAVGAKIIDASRMESKIKSARGLEYTKSTNRTVKTAQVKVGSNAPGVEFQQRVLPRQC
jgi:hypothetical protein